MNLVFTVRCVYHN